MEELRLPINIVVPRRTDHRANRGMGGDRPLCPYTETIKAEIEGQCLQLQHTLNRYFDMYPSTPCIAKVIMKEKAIAKSHKPTAIFNQETCPIVGAGRLNEVLIKVTPKGMRKLIDTVRSASTEKVRNTLTKIEGLAPFSENEKIEIPDLDGSTVVSQPLKVKLFSFSDKIGNGQYVKEFEELLEKLNIRGAASRVYYSKDTAIYRLACGDKELIKQVVMYPGVQRISFFPRYACRLSDPVHSEKVINGLNVPTEGEYPVIGLIDSGVSKNNPLLSPWIYDRAEYVAPEYQNNEHGTFVAGIMEYGNILNDLPIDQAHCKILDVIVLPNQDPSKGRTELLSEEVLIENLHKVAKKYSNVVKEWNMSLGTDIPCAYTISDLAVALDEIQDEYGIVFIMPTGNYDEVPLRGWPPGTDRKDLDRITVPADSVRAITVGSVANIGIQGFVEKDRPSPFTRKGPGANYSHEPNFLEKYSVKKVFFHPSA